VYNACAHAHLWRWTQLDTATKPACLARLQDHGALAITHRTDVSDVASVSYAVRNMSTCAAVDAIFEALCDGAEANPDAMDDDEGNFFYDQAEVSAGMDEGVQERLAALEDRLQLPSAEEFEDMVDEGPVHESDAATGANDPASPEQ
jgi:hypothetical protein